MSLAVDTDLAIPPVPRPAAAAVRGSGGGSSGAMRSAEPPPGGEASSARPTALPRIEHSVVAWWSGVDRWTLGAVFVLVAIGTILTFAASPAVAERIGVPHWYFVQRQMVHLPLAVGVVLTLSLLPRRALRRIAVAGFVIALALMAATLFFGRGLNGATRWISLFGLSLQPSEFVKPCLAVLCGLVLARGRERPDFPGRAVAAGLVALTLLMLVLQPDVGMAALIAAVFLVQLFVSGIALGWVVLLGLVGLGGLVAAYFTFSQVASRVDRFLDPAAGDRFQVGRALDAFASGGLWGRGPGEGIVKSTLPDAHTDFVFAVAGEELGLIACLLILGLYGLIVLRGIGRAVAETQLAAALAAAGLAAQFGLQAMINMASTLHLIPTKGMTLPFLSYGGSSALAVALTLGLLLGFTRAQPLGRRRR